MAVQTGAVASSGGTRERALAVALDMFSRDGYDHVSMREIAEELGVTKAALYHHFTSKEEIARELIGGYLGAVNALVDWARATEPALPDLLARWAELVRTQGMAVGKFIHANQRLVRDLGLHPGEGRRAVDLVADAVVGVAQAPELRMQVRMALICLHTAAIAAEGLGMPDEQVFALAQRVAAEIVEKAAAAQS
jgi:AcrR family transcriptional regulator